MADIRHPRCYKKSMTKPIALFAFDLDGTVANTEVLSIPSAVETMRHFGVPVTLEYWYENLHGLTGGALIQAIQQQFGIEVNLDAYVQRRAELVPIMFANGVQPAPGILQVIRKLAADGHQLCICSNSPPERIRFTLDHITGQHSAGLNLSSLFEGHMFSATGTNGRGAAKPAPDIYLNAAAYYGVNPAACVAIEDSPVGVQSAVAAGFTCLAYTGLCHKGEADAPSLTQAGAHHTFHHWDDFHALVANL